MSVEDRIRQKIAEALSPSHLEVINESHGHNVPKGSETHFKLVIVDECFLGLPRVQRHKMAYALLAEELSSGVHALSMHCYTSEEWSLRSQQAVDSPKCMGGGL
jgi:BolA protein